MTPDVNVLVAAARDDHPQHLVARQWLEKAFFDATSDRPCHLMPMVLASFLRLVTSRNIFAKPTPIDDAVAFIEVLLAVPGVRLAPLGAEWDRFCRLCSTKNLAGNDLPDAWLAAAVVHHGEHLITFDRGFRRLLGRVDLTLLTPSPVG